jgi:hypothetical protein
MPLRVCTVTPTGCPAQQRSHRALMAAAAEGKGLVDDAYAKKAIAKLART